MMESDSLSGSALSILHATLTAAEQRVRNLQAQLDEAQRIQQSWSDITSFADKGWHLHLLKALQGPTRDILIRTAPDQEAVSTAFAEMQARAVEQTQGLNRRFPALLEKSCDQVGIVLDPESRHPTYTIDQRFFQLSFNADKQTVRLSDVEGRLDDVPADIDAVIEVIQRERKRVFERPFNGVEFVKKLYSHYQAVLKREQQADGAVPIRAITRRLGKNEKGFRTDEFIVDLSRLLEEGRLEIDGQRLDLQQTKDTNQGMILHGAAARGYIGFIVFRKMGS